MKDTQNRTIPIRTYYTCREALEKRMLSRGRKEAFNASDQDSYRIWSQNLKTILSDLLGLDNMSPCPVKGETTERTEIEDGIIREKVIIDVEEGVQMPVYILIPPKVNDVPVPCFIAPPGHGGAGKFSVAGCREIPAVKDAIEFYNYDYGLVLAKLGYVAFCPDSRGFGERREADLWKDDEQSFLHSTCFQIAHMAESLGQTVAGMCTWDIMRLIDYIQLRGEWRADKVGCVGFSGGGMQTLWASAMDSRIGISVISGYFYGYRDSLLTLNGNCSCNYVPKLWLHADMCDIAALAAPNPVLIQSCSEDHLNGPRGMANVYEQLEVLKKAYRLFGAQDRIFHDIRPGDHCFYPEPLKDFLEYAEKI